MDASPHLCQKCGTPVAPRHRPQRLKPEYSKYCENCRKRPSWKNGAPIGATRIQQLKGKKPYRWVRIHNPGGKQWVQEHRLVMEQLLGRPLADDERVHHKNEHDTLNNSPDNLVLMTHAEHTIHHNSIGNRWSVKHDCCIKCGTRETPHAAHGICEKCRPRDPGWHRFKPKPTAERMWAHRLRVTSCVACGTTERKHYSLGLCWSCYQKQKRRENPARFRAYDQTKRHKKLAKANILY